MVFSSITFLFAFFPAVLLVYYICPRKFRNLVLFIFSLIFYGWGEPRYIIIMLISITIGYAAGMLVEKYNKTENDNKAKFVMIAAVALNLLTLVYFKYSNLLSGTFGNIFGPKVAEIMKASLPIGISFYTFQILSYVVDVYRKEVPAERSFITLGAYISLFPQLIAGPIVRYQTVAKELESREESLELFSNGVLRFVIGVGKKVLIANQCGAIFETLSNLSNDKNTVILTWISGIAFTFQIYFDFSGYSDMAIGLGKMFGFNFLENFEHPYISKSITEFWRRWHISLSSWFKDYLYIPLGGNRKGEKRTYINLFIVWMLTGIWHGVTWNFIIWGLFYYVVLMVEKVGFKKVVDKAPAWVSHIYSLFIINLGWVIFSYDDLGRLVNALKNMFFLGGLPFINDNSVFYLLNYAVILFVAGIGSSMLPVNTYRLLADKISGSKMSDENKEIVSGIIMAVFVIAIMFLSVASLASDSFNPFLYFRF